MISSNFAKKNTKLRTCNTENTEIVEHASFSADLRGLFTTVNAKRRKLPGIH